MKNRELELRVKHLERWNTRLMWENLKLRLDTEVVAENPEGKAAKKIIASWRRRKDRRNEMRLAAQN
jgi:hypothetical protein